MITSSLGGLPCGLAMVGLLPAAPVTSGVFAGGVAAMPGSLGEDDADGELVELLEEPLLALSAPLLPQAAKNKTGAINTRASGRRTVVLFIDLQLHGQALDALRARADAP